MSKSIKLSGQPILCQLFSFIPDTGGATEIVNGNGTSRSFFPGGQLMESGTVKDGFKVGLWKKNYEDGSRQEEGEFRNGTYYLTNSWSTDAKPMITNGEGTFKFGPE